jgi:two-component system sensor histidine kinase ResE
MSTTIDELLVDARSRTRTIERQPTDVRDVVRRVVAELHPLAAANDVIVTTVGADDGPITAAIDRQSVERALTNLVANAIDVGPAGSAVTVAISSTANTVAMTVTDEGPGIAEADQEKVFERYWRADEASQRADGSSGNGPRGEGIGLSIVRHVATAHGGSVTVRSPIADGVGTEFLFELAR